MSNNINELSAEEKRSLLAQLLQNKIRTSKSSPLSYAQERLWFLDQFQPGLPIYNIPLTILFPGPLNISALKQSLHEIVRRHETLRTTFQVIKGQPVQVIAPPAALEMPVLELREMPETMREAEVQRLAAKEAQHVFDLARGPLFRVTLVRVADADHRLLLNMHHIISDGWSVGVLLRELTVLYDAYASGRKSPLEELPLQYAEYARQQREYLSGERLKEQLSYWREQLAGAPPLLEMPTDRARPVVQTFRGAWQSFTVRPEVFERLKQVSKAEGVTLFMTLLAAFKTLLYRYTGQADLVVGTPIANRNRADIEGLIGFFVNTLVLRTQLSGQMSFVEVVRQVREVTLGAYGHQDLPFEKLVEELQPERNLSHNPLFQVMFALQNTPTMGASSDSAAQSSSESEETNLDVPDDQPPPIYLGLAKFDLTLSLSEAGGALTGTFEYNTDLFNHETITRMIKHYQRVLEQVAHAPQQCLAELSLLSAEERQQLLVQWNNTGAPLPKTPVPQMFEAQVERTPSAVAVISEQEQVSYQELNRRANQVAHYLRRAGVGAEVRVGVCMERGVEMVVGILGILKAGGAYVPLDPGYPAERLAFMMKDAQIQVLLSHEPVLKDLPEYDCKVICLNADWKQLSQESDENLVSNVTAGNLMVVFYTSGSTGRPKGSLLSDQGFLNLFNWFGAECSTTGKPRALLMTPFSFDASFKVIITPLLIGGVLVLASADQYDIEKLLQTIEEQEVSTTFTTPSLLYSLLDLAKENDYQSLSSLRSIFFGGEPTEVPKLKPWLNSHNCNCQLIHNYGPSECSDVTTVYKPSLNDIDVLNDLPIGVPIDNVHVHVMDKDMNLQPVGVAGELYISGLMLARGYLNRPELTAEKFVPNPFEQGERLYKTGDQVRWLPTGQLQFLGRVDNQVKIRGIRIELGEIEAVLGQHPDVENSIVIAREVSHGNKRLFGYVTLKEGLSHEVWHLQRYLKERLPEYMVPPSLVVLDSLPMSPNGKVDRNALPAPESINPETASRFVEPSNPVEEVVAGIWGEVLKLERVSRNDNFFELGGHSLLATQVISRLRNSLQIELPVRRIFEAPTLAEFSAWMRQESVRHADIEERASLLLKISRLSDEEAEAMLHNRNAEREAGR